MRTSKPSASRLLLLTRVICFFAIAVGIVSLLSTWTGEMGGAIHYILVSPNDALGLIFVGFAVRLSRLEAHRLPMRIVVRTSRVCLIVQGLAALGGTEIMVFLPSAVALAGGEGASMAAGVIYLLIAGSLLLRLRYAQSEFRSILTALLCGFLGLCWISLLLAGGGLAPVPAMLRIEILPLLILTGVGVILATLTRVPGMLRVLSDQGPEAEAARTLFPLAFAIPLVLAILRHWAEAAGLLHRDLGLLLHVIISAGCMAAMIIWNSTRISEAARAIRSAEKLVDDFESQYRAILGAISDAVWIFDPKGQLVFSNRAAGEYCSGEDMPGKCVHDPGSALGSGQQSAVMGAALFGKRMREIRMFDMATGDPRLLMVQYLGVLYTREAKQSAIVLVARPGATIKEEVVEAAEKEPVRVG